MVTAENNVRELNLKQLRVLQNVISQLSPVQYSQPVQLPHAPTIGRHVRHIIEHYQQLLSALTDGQLNYANRPRETNIERQPRLAREQLTNIKRTLEATALLTSYPLVLHANGQELPTSWGRELEFVHSHTVHHLALIHIIAKEFDIPLNDAVGVHPSTMEYLRQCAR